MNSKKPTEIKSTVNAERDTEPDTGRLDLEIEELESRIAFIQIEGGGNCASCSGCSSRPR